MIKKYLFKIQMKIRTIPISLIILLTLILTFTLSPHADAKGENVTVLKLPIKYSASKFPLYPALSGNGEKMFYFSKVGKKDSRLEIFSIDLKNWKKEQITKRNENTLPQFAGITTNIASSYDGSKIAFNSINDYTGENIDSVGYEVFLLDTTNKTINQISDENVLAVLPKLSADGNKILFATIYIFGVDSFRIAGFDSLTSLFLYDAENDKLTEIINDASNGNENYELGRNGEKAVFFRSSDLKLYDIETNTETTVDVFTNTLTLYDINTDGSLLLVKDGYNNISLYNTNENEFTTITNNYRVAPTFMSGDGKRGFLSSTFYFLNPKHKDNETLIYMFDCEKKRIYQITKFIKDVDYDLSSGSTDGRRFLIERDTKGNSKKANKKYNGLFLYELTNTRKAELKIKQGKEKKDSFSALIDYDFEDSSFNPMTNTVYAEVGTFTETLKAENFTANQKGTIFRYTPSQDKKSGIYKMVLNKSKGVIKIRGNNLNLSGTKYTFPLLLESTGLDIDEKLTVKKKKNRNQDKVKKLIFKANRKLGNGTSENVFP